MSAGALTIPRRARAIASKLSRAFTEDSELAKRLNDAQQRLQAANDRLRSGLHPDGFAALYGEHPPRPGRRREPPRLKHLDAPLALSATGGSIAPCASASFDGGVPLPLTQTQLASAVADRAEISRTDAKRVLGVLEEIVLEELGNAQKVRIGGLVQLTVRVKPAQKARQGRNPATGEEITIAAKPASVDLRAQPLAKAKTALPTVQKARRRLAV
ncbi:MAG: HU family DNA-binding protein [Solirubrobacteraceae bacterium]